MVDNIARQYGKENRVISMAAVQQAPFSDVLLESVARVGHVETLRIGGS